jgi:hypothetical protein
MSVGSNLQEMENVVTKGAAPAEPMPSAGIPVEDLGGVQTTIRQNSRILVQLCPR